MTPDQFQEFLNKLTILKKTNQNQEISIKKEVVKQKNDERSASPEIRPSTPTSLKESKKVAPTKPYSDTPTNKGRSEANEEQIEAPLPLSAPEDSLNDGEKKESSFSPPEPSPSPSTILDEEKERNEGQVLRPTQPSIFQIKDKAKQGQRTKITPTIPSQSIGELVRRSEYETLKKNEQVVISSFSLAFLIVGLSLFSSIILNSLIKTGSTFFEYLQEGEENEEEEENNPSFFVSTHFFTPNLTLGAYVVATNAAPQFKKDMKLDVELLPFMVGKIIGILDEAQCLVIIEVFPKRSYIFESQVNYITPFVYLDEFESSFLFKIKFLFEDLFEKIQNFY